jgi:hypothetical protein
MKFLIRVFLLTLFVSICASEKRAGIVEAEIIEEKFIRAPFKKARVYPKNFSAYRFMVGCKQLARQNPHHQQVRTQGAHGIWVDHQEALTNTANTPLKDSEWVGTRCIHTAQIPAKYNIQYTTTTYTQPNWSEKKVKKIKRKETIVEVNERPPEFYDLYRKIQKPTQVNWPITRYILRKHHPCVIQLDITKNNQYICRLIERVESVGTLRLVDQQSTEQTMSTPLLQDFLQEKSDAESKRNEHENMVDDSQLELTKVKPIKKGKNIQELTPQKKTLKNRFSRFFCCYSNDED